MILDWTSHAQYEPSLIGPPMLALLNRLLASVPVRPYMDRHKL